MQTCSLRISLWSLLMSAFFCWISSSFCCIWVSFCSSSSSLCLSLLSLNWVVSCWTVVTWCSSCTSFCWRSASSLVFSSYFILAAMHKHLRTYLIVIFLQIAFFLLFGYKWYFASPKIHGTCSYRVDKFVSADLISSYPEKKVTLR